jgi:hypothetical protein
MINDNPIRWISTRQKIVETSTYDSESVASRIAMELILEIRCMIQSLRLALNGQERMLIGKMSLVLNTKVSSILSELDLHFFNRNITPTKYPGPSVVSGN